MTSAKRDRHVFEAVQQLDEEDAIALTKRKASSKRQKQNSLAAISQQKIQAKLLEVRILLQRALQNEDEDALHTSSAADEKLRQCKSLLEKLLSARDSLVANVTDKDDDGDDDGESESEKTSKELALEQQLQKGYEKCEQEWEKVLNQRHKDVRLHAGLTSKSQFRALDASFWQQVQQTVTHEKMMQTSSSTNGKTGSIQPFDDSKVYQQLLKDFLSASADKKQGEGGSSLRASQSKRTVNQVDRRASKGRKIRYTTVAKLVNFTFPLSRPASSNMLDEDAWFRSLFGGVQSKRKSSRDKDS